MQKLHSGKSEASQNLRKSELGHTNGQIYVCAEDSPTEFRTQNTPKPDRPQQDSPPRVIDQQYASATFATLRLYFLKEKFGAL
jgi:hypothetical protein